MEQKPKLQPAIAALIVIVLVGIVASVAIVVANNSNGDKTTSTNGDFTAESHRRSAYQSIASHPVAGPLLAAGALAVAARMMGPPRDTARRLATLGAATLAGKALMAATFEA